MTGCLNFTDSHMIISTGGGDSWEQGLHPDDSSRAIEECQVALRGERDFDTDFRILHPDGTVVHIKANGLVLRDEEGKPLRMIGLNTDITERKRAEEALKKSEEKHRVLFESSHDAIMTLAPPSWQFTSGNPGAIEMFKTGDGASFVVCGPEELSPEFQPDGRPSSEKAAEMIQAAMTKGSHFFEWTHKRLRGEPFPATVLLTRMEISGQTLLQATVRDITERKTGGGGPEAKRGKIPKYL